MLGNMFLACIDANVIVYANHQL